MRFRINRSNNPTHLAERRVPERKKVQLFEVYGVLLLALMLLAFGCDEEGDGDGAKAEEKVYKLDALPDCTGGKLDPDADPTLCWQVPAPNENMTWEAAITYCDTLELEGYDDWRLPNVDDLRTIIRGCKSTATGGACDARPNEPSENWEAGCGGCAASQGPSTNGCYTNKEFGACKKKPFYTSSSTGTGDLSDATRYNIFVNFDKASIGIDAATASVRCVRTVGTGTE